MGPPIFVGGEVPRGTGKPSLLKTSMGPPIFVGGEMRDVTTGAADPDPTSMGPPIFVGGENLVAALLKKFKETSMGPPIFVGGEGWAIFPNRFNLLSGELRAPSTGSWLVRDAWCSAAQAAFHSRHLAARAGTARD